MHVQYIDNRQTCVVVDWRWGCEHTCTLILTLQAGQIGRRWHAAGCLANILQAMPVSTSCTHTYAHSLSQIYNTCISHTDRVHHSHTVLRWHTAC